MPIIENAFKHVSHFINKKNVIEIQINISKGSLRLFTKNTISKEKMDTELTKEYSGIGLQNVNRRLDLLYSGKHKITSKKDDEHYFNSLELQLQTHYETSPKLA